jgi:hypothetical protein
MIEEMLLWAHRVDLETAAWKVAAAQQARRPAGARGARSTETAEAAGAWCWLLDRVPAHARRHAAA